MSVWSGLSDFAKLIVVGSGASGVVLLVRAYKTLVEIGMRRSDNQIARWQRLFERADEQLHESENERNYAEEVRDFWRMRSGDLEYALRQANIPVPAPREMPRKKPLTRKTNGASYERYNDGDTPYSGHRGRSKPSA